MAVHIDAGMLVSTKDATMPAVKIVIGKLLESANPLLTALLDSASTITVPAAAAVLATEITAAMVRSMAHDDGLSKDDIGALRAAAGTCAEEMLRLIRAEAPATGAPDETSERWDAAGKLAAAALRRIGEER